LGWIDDGTTGSTFATSSTAGLASALMTVFASNTEGSVKAARALVVDHADWHRNISRLETALFN
jgi:hypothetical protein